MISIVNENPTFLDKMSTSNPGDTFNVYSGSKNYKVTNKNGSTFEVHRGKGYDPEYDAFLREIQVNGTHDVHKDDLVRFIKSINQKNGYRESIEDN